MKWLLFQIGKPRPRDAKSLAQSHGASKDGGGTGTLPVMHLVTQGEKDWGPLELQKYTQLLKEEH